MESAEDEALHSRLDAIEEQLARLLAEVIVARGELPVPLRRRDHLTVVR
jgi:tetrahydromethanopterin S-methyltransferase subunit G